MLHAARVVAGTLVRPHFFPGVTIGFLYWPTGQPVGSRVVRFGSAAFVSRSICAPAIPLSGRQFVMTIVRSHAATFGHSTQRPGNAGVSSAPVASVQLKLLQLQSPGVVQSESKTDNRFFAPSLSWHSSCVTTKPRQFNDRMRSGTFSQVRPARNPVKPS